MPLFVFGGTLVAAVEEAPSCPVLEVEFAVFISFFLDFTFDSFGASYLSAESPPSSSSSEFLKRLNMVSLQLTNNARSIEGSGDSCLRKFRPFGWSNWVEQLLPVGDCLVTCTLDP